MVHSASRIPLEVGTVIAGTYTIERLIGKGGMGAVFLASHARLPGKKVAIKVLFAEIADPESLIRFRREAEIASRLGHANIVEVHDFNELPDGTPYLVLEYLAGESLGARIARGPMSLEQTVTVVRQIGSALAAAHREDIIHRDLKPQNVFLVATETDGFITERAKVLDFGISKIRGSTTLKTQDTSILGTPQYMAPEQALGNHAAVDGRTDVFALGAMVYEMLCGKPAFSGASIPEVVFRVVYEEPQPLSERVPMLAPHIAAAVHRALAKKADERFPDVGGFIEALTGQPLASGKRSISMAGAATPGALAAMNALGPVTPTGTVRGIPPSSPPPMRTNPATQSDKVESREAFAHTIGSGDHASALLGIDQTVASAVSGPIVPARPVVATTTLGHSAGAMAETVAAPAPHRGGLIIAGLAIVALTAVAIVFMVTRKPAPQTAQPAAAVTPDAAARVAAGPTPDAAVAALVAIDAATPAVAIDAGAGKVSGKVKGSGEPRVVAEEPEPAAIKECQGALRAGDAEEALLCANKVLAKAPGTAAAYVVKANAYCALDDQEQAQTASRKLLGKPKLRKKVLEYCRRQGVEFD